MKLITRIQLAWYSWARDNLLRTNPAHQDLSYVLQRIADLQFSLQR